MGNTACCAGEQAGGKACCSNQSKDAKDLVGAPVAGEPIPSSEVLGIDKIATPGFNSKAEISEAKDGSAVANKCPGGDSAAGGDSTLRDNESQTVTYDDGSTYTGQVVNGKRHGQGLWQSRTGQYEGQWQSDVQHGSGHQTWSDGRVYDGQFENGKFAGKGRMVWHTQKGLLTYEGQYKDDLKHGTGKFVWADGRTYDGMWREGKRHGRGMYMNARCEQKVGYWNDDKFERWETNENETHQA